MSDLLAIRKNHRLDKDGLKRGDLFEMILIQTKEICPTANRGRYCSVVKDSQVSQCKNYCSCKMATGGGEPDVFKLKGNEWRPVAPAAIFG